MSWMFYNSKFNQDISNWDVNNVINMNSMFEVSNFNQDISKWDISSVINMDYMFKCSNFNKNISNWFNKLNLNISLLNFGVLNKIAINSYDNFKQYHREMILKKL